MFCFCDVILDLLQFHLMWRIDCFSLFQQLQLKKLDSLQSAAFCKIIFLLLLFSAIKRYKMFASIRCLIMF